MAKKVVPVKVRSMYNYIKIFNGFMDLTHRELKVLSGFAEIQQSFAGSEVVPNIFSSEFKRRVAEDLGYHNSESLNNYVRVLLEKGAIEKRKEGGYKVKKHLIPSKNEEEIVLKLHKGDD